MRNQELEIINALNNRRQRYAKATVVRRKIPSSGKPGDSAIILEDGTMHGWIGGGCTQGIVLKEALLAIKDGKTKFISISPEAIEGAESDTKLYTMTCQSGGAVDLFIEPILPKPQLVIFGTSHIAMALAKIGLAMDYRVTAVHPQNDASDYGHLPGLSVVNSFDKEELSENTYLIVCTQGHGDEEALEAAVNTDNNYIAFVSSRKKAHAIFNTLRSRGITFDQLKRIKTPAGLDIHAKLPEEVAVSILAQIIEDIRKPLEDADSAAKLSSNIADYYINPVCDIPVHKPTAKHVLTYQDESVYFCCDGCKVKFEAAPEKYMAEKV